MSWKPYAQALLRGGIRAMALGGGGAKTVAQLIQKHDDVVAEQAVPSIQSYTGLDLPPRGVAVGGAEQLATAAWVDVRVGDQEALQAQVAELLSAGDDDAQRAILKRLARKLPTALLRHQPLRRTLMGGHAPGAVSGGGVGLKVMAGVGALAFVAALAGFVATRPRIDREPPELKVKVAGGSKVAARSVEISGEIVEDDLVQVTVDGKPVLTESTGPVRYRFRASVELPQLGERSVEVVATDRKGLTSKRLIRLERVPFPVTIVVTEPGAAVRGGRTVLRGKATSEGELEVVVANGKELELDSDGTFSGLLEFPERTGKQRLHLLARGPESFGELDTQVLIDHDPPQIKVQPHDAVTWSDHYELPVQVVDSSPWVSVALLSGGTARPHRTKTGVLDHLPIEIGEGKSTLRLQATDPAGNKGPVVEVHVERKKPSPHLERFAQGKNRFKITEELKIAAHDALVLPPGAVIEVSPDVAILVAGKLLSPGTSERRIALGGKGWAGITLVGKEASAELRFTTIHGAKKELGGALAITGGGRLRAFESVFKDNVAGRHGGALYTKGGGSGKSAQVDLERVRFERNHANAEGGAVSFNTNTRATLASCTFERNDAKGYGGGMVTVSVKGSASTEVTLRDSHFLLNRAPYGGGALVGKHSRARFTGGHFESNNATKNGGGLYLVGSAKDQLARLEVQGTRFVHNRGLSGGGVHVHSYAEARLRGAVFERNTATRYGGGLMALGREGQFSALDLKDCHFDQNEAQSGGGLNANYFTSTRAEDCVFVRNKSPRGWGGGLCVVGNSADPTRFDMIACHFKGNTSKDLHGPDVRIAANVVFDPQQLRASGVGHSRASVAADVHPQRPTAAHAPPRVAPPAARAPAKVAATPARRSSPTPKPTSERPSLHHMPDPPPTQGMLVNVDDDFGRALAHYVAAAARKDYHALRDEPYGGSHRLKSYTAKVQFPDAVSVRIWDSGRKHYASVTITNTAPDDEAHEAFDATVDRLQDHLSKGWRRSDHERKNTGSRVTTFTHAQPLITIRVTYTRFKLRAGMRSSVMVFFN